MTRFHRQKRTILAASFMAAVVLGFSPSELKAQFGGFGGFGGGGFGFGWGAFSQVPKPESYLYSQALVDAQRDTHIPSRNVYANNSNSYINHVRDNGFVEHYDVARRDPSYYHYGSPPPPTRPSNARTTAVPTSMTVAQQTPSLPLASFYNASGQIVWPADAPTAGDLSEKRATFDKTSQVVLSELKKSGVASIATVTDARQKLLDYGRPGLQYVRSHETPRVADTFHLFLLSLYESLAQAINPVAATGPGAATPAS